MTSVSQLTSTIESWYPLHTADEWDAPGLVCGEPNASVSKALLTVDVTLEVVNEAIESGAQLIVAHHPFLLRGVKTLDESLAKGATLAAAIRAGVALYAAHTNADIAVDGVSAALASAVNLTDARPLVGEGSSGHGRIGKVEATSLGALAQLLASSLPATATGVRVAGDFDQRIESIALCAGAGDAFIGAAIEQGADVFITSDLRHHPVQDAREHAALNGGKPAIIDISHWAAEYLWLDAFAAKLQAANPSIEFVVSDLRTDPWDFVITQ